MGETRRERPDRLPTNSAGLDVITGGGLPRGGIYLVIGRPGAGKSILGNQLAYGHAARKGRAVYATLLSETHTRLLGQMRQLSFFDEKAVGKQVIYLNALSPLEANGLDGLLESVQKMVREHGADLLVLDGLLPPLQLGVDELPYKNIAALQSWVGLVGCTVLILKTGTIAGTGATEQTMVDGILELTSVSAGMRTLRQLEVTKLRGSAFAEGKHSYLITDDGATVFPRAEAAYAVDESKSQPHGDRVSTGVPGLDPILGGALVRGSTTLVLGSSGAGKSIMASQFVVDGARAGEKTLHYGFYEPPHALKAKGARLGLDIEGLAQKGLLEIVWHNRTELILDRIVNELLSIVRAREIKRVAFDGFAALRTCDHPDRVSCAFTVLTNELSRAGVTSIFTDETRELYIREIEVPTQDVSALFHNIVFLRQVELEAELLRLMGVMKTRDSAHNRRLWEADIDDTGLRLVRPFQAGNRGLIGGGEVRSAARTPLPMKPDER